MLFCTQFITLSVILLSQADYVAAKKTRNVERNLKIKREYVVSDADEVKDEWSDFDMQQMMQMSIPSTTGSPTSSPTFPVLFLDEDDIFDEFSLKECQGDCDDDSDCDFGLICFFRDDGTPDVPGCQGNADLVGDGLEDFCIRPPTDNTLVIVGDGGFPESVYPLQKCQGDCDNDNDCAGNLVCFERDADEVVNGCIGFGGSTWDYCYDPFTTEVTLDWIGDPEEEWDYYELQQCQGDCDYDSDCAIGMVCFQRQYLDSGVVPDCLGDANQLGTGADDFCIPRPSNNYLASVYDDREGADLGTYPMGQCQGDCDSDVDCATGLTCFNRNGFDPVPGCIGDGEQDYDYCI